MYSGLTNRFVPIVKKFPRASAAVFLAAGFCACITGLREARELDRFRGGVAVEGYVDAVVDASTWRPRYSADIAVEVAGGERVLQRVGISNKEARTLARGVPMLLVQARDGSIDFVRESHLKAASIVDIGGRPVTFQVFLGLAFLAFGMWLFLAGPRMLATPNKSSSRSSTRGPTLRAPAKPTQRTRRS